jgi:hypothetical protein
MLRAASDGYTLVIDFGQRSKRRSLSEAVELLVIVHLDAAFEPAKLFCGMRSPFSVGAFAILRPGRRRFRR